jgi:hypothetical protein
MMSFSLSFENFEFFPFLYLLRPFSVSLVSSVSSKLFSLYPFWIIHSDDDVSSMDADSSPPDWARLNKLSNRIFFDM